MRPLVRAAAAAALIGTSACGDDLDETPPVLSRPMIDLTHVVQFVPFGAALPGSGVPNPAYELRTDDGTLDVVAVSPGIVAAIRTNDQGDSEIEIRPSEKSIYAVIYDHVRELAVGVGMEVQPGTTILGRIGTESSGGRVELQINRDGNPTLALCPVQFGTPEFNTLHFDAMVATSPTASALCVRDSVEP